MLKKLKEKIEIKPCVAICGDIELVQDIMKIIAPSNFEIKEIEANKYKFSIILQKD